MNDLGRKAEGSKIQVAICSKICNSSFIRIRLATGWLSTIVS